MKLYASPKGTAMRMVKESRKWRKSPEDGEPNGQLDAQKRGKGRTPSLASSWMTRACAKVVVMAFPKAEIATRTLDYIRCVLIGGSRGEARHVQQGIPQGTLGGGSKNPVHEERGHCHSTIGNFIWRTGGIVRHVGQDIESAADEERSGSGDLHRMDGVFDFVHHVCSIGPSEKASAGFYIKASVDCRRHTRQMIPSL